MREDYELRNKALMGLYPDITTMKNVETENEVFLDKNGKEIIISNTDVEERITILQAEHDANQYQRDRASEYPPIGDQLDMIYKDMKNGTTTHAEAVEEVKTKYPKG
jgi:hypothetical protein